MSNPISLKKKSEFNPDDINKQDLGFEIVMPISVPEIQEYQDFGDIQEVQFGKMPLSEVFALKLKKKAIRIKEKAIQRRKRRKANKAAGKARKG